MKILGMGVPELLIILAVALLIFGPKNLPKLGSALGKTVKNLRDGIGTKEADEEEDEDAIEEVEEVEEEPAPVKKTATRSPAKKEASSSGAKKKTTANKSKSDE